MNFNDYYFKEEADVKVIVNDDSFEGKTDPTQYSSDEEAIIVKSSYDTKNDPEGWMVHERVHAKKHHDDDDDGKPYPENNTEALAYSEQFKWLKKTGKAKSFEELKDTKKFPTLSLKFTKFDGEWEPILKKYWVKVNGE